MKKTRTILVAAALALCVGSVWAVAGCSSNSDDSLTGDSSLQSAAPIQRGGAQIWAENCARCHNSRSPTTLSDAQWDIVTMHMRIQAGLTKSESEKVLLLLQASN